MSRVGPSSDVFRVLQAGDVKQLWGGPPGKLRPFLPYLVRMALGPTSLLSDCQNGTWARDRKLVLSLIAGEDVSLARTTVSRGLLLSMPIMYRMKGARPGGVAVNRIPVYHFWGVPFQKSQRQTRSRPTSA